jgi:23S rRNA pseudouridine1911/1915/1917 synthase
MVKSNDKNIINDVEILYEDKDILALNKPAGLVVHSDGRTKEPLLTDWILEKYPKTKDVGEPIVTTNGIEIYRPGIVHRLDRETSGVILVAKTSKGHAHLKEQFQARTMSKRYIAFVHGKMEDKYGVISKPIGRSSKDFRKWTSGRAVRGEMRSAETWFTTIDIGRDENGKFYTLIEAEPRTGRTHQIRVHMEDLHHPVVCDSLYGKGKENAIGFKRTALQAYTIDFVNLKGEKIEIKASLPEDFIYAIKELGIKGPVDLPKN